MRRAEAKSFAWMAWLGGAAALAGAGAATVYAVNRARGKVSRVPGVVAGVGGTVAVLSAWEVAWWARRRARRRAQYLAARAEADRIGRPLVVIGAPDAGTTSNYECGDVTVDIAGSACPNTLVADVTKPLPFADDSVVVFVSCVLEYVDDAKAALEEIRRVSGGNAFFCGVEPWTLTGILHPGRRRSLPAAQR